MRLFKCCLYDLLVPSLHWFPEQHVVCAGPIPIVDMLVASGVHVFVGQEYVVITWPAKVTSLV